MVLKKGFKYQTMAKTLIFSISSFFNNFFFQRTIFSVDYAILFFFLSVLGIKTKNAKLGNYHFFLIFPSFEKIYTILKVFRFHHIPIVFQKRSWESLNFHFYFQISRRFFDESFFSFNYKKKNAIFLIEKNFYRKHFLTKIKKIPSIFSLLFDANKKERNFYGLKKPFLKTKKFFSSQHKFIKNTKKAYWIKIRSFVCATFFFFWELRNNKLNKAIIYSLNFTNPKKTKALINSFGMKIHTIGPWLTKRKILKRVKSFNSTQKVFLILFGDFGFSKKISKKIDIREVSIFFHLESLGWDKKKIFA